MGLVRNLAAAEILGQVLRANAVEHATHLVFMGMGEPLANYAEVVKTLKILTDAKLGLGYSPRRITVSTVGLVTGIEKLGRENLKVNLAISLLAAHAGEPRVEPRGAHGGRAALPAGAAAARVLRVRAARRGERRARRCPAPGAPAAHRARQGEPDPVQRLAGLRVSPAAARAHPRLPVDPARRRHHHHRALEQGRGHRRGLRPVEGGGGVTSRRVAFATLGCRLNQVDSQRLQAALEARGFSTVAFGAAADVVVVNTCTVTARAEVSDRQAIRRARRANPDARVVVTGCWAQTSADEVAREAGVDLVVGNADKERLPALLDEILEGPRPRAPRVEVGDLRGARLADVDPRPRALGRSRAFLKIQDGCQHRCAFCIVPRARGASRSLEPKLVADQVRLLVEAGRPEVTLTGIDLGHYGADLVPRTSLAALLCALVEIDGLRWLRL